MENGRYYVSNHGKRIEVTKAQFTHSRYHCYAVWCTHAIAMITLLLTLDRKKSAKPALQKTESAQS